MDKDKKTRKSVALIILDGWGYSKEKDNNAISEAKTPFFDSLIKKYPHALLGASGPDVGLPEGQMGNSEVGHITIGAGKIIDTDLVRISKSASKGEFIQNPAFTTLFDHVKKYGSTLHVKGLIGPGGVHGHSEHLYEFLKTAKKSGIEKIAIHAFTDGRDTPPQSAAKHLEELEEVIAEVGVGFIATASGRFYAMDRDHNWDRLAKTEKAIFNGEGKKHQTQRPSEIVKELYQQGIVDEHIEPIVFLDLNGNSYRIQDNDGVFYFNFRADRARQLSQIISEQVKRKNLCFVTLTEYNKTLNALTAFPPIEVETTLANEISKAGLKQVHIAETEKFAHATYYLNCGKTDPHKDEIQKLIESRKDIDTHDKAPKMRAEEIANAAIEYIEEETDFIFVNFANADMVGHTGNKQAIIESIEEVDHQLKKVIESLENHNGIAIVSADHGNAEIIFDHTSNSAHTAHTTNPVPIILTRREAKLRNGTLADIAPTILDLLNIRKPDTMTGNNLIIK